MFSTLTDPERGVKVEINEGVEIAGQGPLGWHLLDCSPFNPR
jgi:hypothetical protein